MQVAVCVVGEWAAGWVVEAWDAARTRGALRCQQRSQLRHPRLFTPEMQQHITWAINGRVYEMTAVAEDEMVYSKRRGQGLA